MQLEEYNFSEEEIKRLQIYRDAQQDTRLQKRFLSLLMVAEGASIEFAVSVLGVSGHSMRNWFKNYLQKGIDSLNSFQYQPRRPNLTETQLAELKDWVKKKPRQPRNDSTLY